MHFLGFWLIFQLLFVGASSKETTMTYIVFSKLSNSRICIICIYIPKFTNVNIIMYHFFSISNSHSFFNSIQLSTRRGSRLHIIVRTFLYMLLYFSTTPAQKYMYCGRGIGIVIENGGNDLSWLDLSTCQWRAGNDLVLVYFFWGVNKRISRNQ